LGLDQQNGPLWEQIDEHDKQIRSCKREMEELKETKGTYHAVMDDAEEQLEAWEKLKDDCEDGNTVFAPMAKNRKKRKSGGGGGTRKRQKMSSEDFDADFSDVDNEDENEESSASEEEEAEEEVEDRGASLTIDQIKTKIDELKNIKKEARRQKVNVDIQLKDTRQKISEIQALSAKIEADIAKVCIEWRNDYSRGAIQQDFAAGMKELDQELAIEEDEENFNPDDDIRDYDEVAKSLPVFCVSSRGYQKLSGRMKKDASVPGFMTIKETEIPELQSHCKSLTVAGRQATCKRFLTTLSQLLNSLTLWASNDGNGLALTLEQRAAERNVIRKSLVGLDKGFEKIITSVVKELNNEFEDNIFDKYAVSIASAREEAMNICSKWGLPVNRGNRAAGGLHHQTYKGICRRDGVYSNAQGPHDWNGQLIGPLMKHLSSGWEKTFTRRIPAVLDNLVKNSGNLLRTFHSDVHSRATKTGVGLAGISMLEQQLQVYEEIFQGLAAEIRAIINTQQREISREFVPVIAAAMASTYEACAAERGIGCFMRMKSLMLQETEQKRQSMFEDSAKEVERRLKKLTREIEEVMANKTDEVHVAVSRDYSSVLLGGEVLQGQIMAGWQRTMRREVMDCIGGADDIFNTIPGSKSEDATDGMKPSEDAGENTMVEDTADEGEQTFSQDIEAGPGENAARETSKAVEAPPNVTSMTTDAPTLPEIAASQDNPNPQAANENDGFISATSENSALDKEGEFDTAMDEMVAQEPFGLPQGKGDFTSAMQAMDDQTSAVIDDDDDSDSLLPASWAKSHGAFARRFSGESAVAL